MYILYMCMYMYKCVYTCVCVCVCVVYTHHIFFIHSFINGHLGCFHVSMLVNNVEMDMGIQIFLWDSDHYSFEYILRSWTTVLHGSHILTFLGLVVQVFIMLYQFIFSTIVHEFPFLHITTSICYLFSFW